MSYKLKSILTPETFDIVNDYLVSGNDALSLMNFTNKETRANIVSRFQALANPEYVNARTLWGSKVAEVPFEAMEGIPTYTNAKNNSFALKYRNNMGYHLRFPLINSYNNIDGGFKPEKTDNLVKTLHKIEKALNFKAVAGDNKKDFIKVKDGIVKKVVKKVASPIRVVRAKTFEDRFGVSESKVGFRKAKLLLSSKYNGKDITAPEQVVAIVDYYSNKVNEKIANKFYKLKDVDDGGKIVLGAQILTDLFTTYAYDLGKENNLQIENSLKLQLSNVIASLKNDESIEAISKTALRSTRVLMKKLNLDIEAVVNNRKNLGVEYLKAPATMQDMMFGQTKNVNFEKVENDVEFKGKSAFLAKYAKEHNIEPEMVLNNTAPEATPEPTDATNVDEILNMGSTPKKDEIPDGDLFEQDEKQVKPEEEEKVIDAEAVVEEPEAPKEEVVVEPEIEKEPETVIVTPAPEKAPETVIVTPAPETIIVPPAETEKKTEKEEVIVPSLFEIMNKKKQNMETVKEKCKFTDDKINGLNEKIEKLTERINVLTEIITEQKTEPEFHIEDFKSIEAEVKALEALDEQKNRPTAVKRFKEQFNAYQNVKSEEKQETTEQQTTLENFKDEIVPATLNTTKTENKAQKTLSDFKNETKAQTTLEDFKAENKAQKTLSDFKDEYQAQTTLSSFKDELPKKKHIITAEPIPTPKTAKIGNINPTVTNINISIYENGKGKNCKHKKQEEVSILKMANAKLDNQKDTLIADMVKERNANLDKKASKEAQNIVDFATEIVNKYEQRNQPENKEPIIVDTHQVKEPEIIVDTEYQTKLNEAILAGKITEKQYAEYILRLKKQLEENKKELMAKNKEEKAKSQKKLNDFYDLKQTAPTNNDEILETQSKVVQGLDIVPVKPKTAPLQLEGEVERKPGVIYAGPVKTKPETDSDTENGGQELKITDEFPYSVEFEQTRRTTRLPHTFKTKKKFVAKKQKEEEKVQEEVKPESTVVNQFNDEQARIIIDMNHFAPTLRNNAKNCAKLLAEKRTANIVLPKSVEVKARKIEKKKPLPKVVNQKNNKIIDKSYEAKKIKTIIQERKMFK